MKATPVAIARKDKRKIPNATGVEVEVGG